MSCGAEEARHGGRAGDGRGKRIGTEDQRIAAVVQRVVDRKVASRLGHSRRLPGIEPLACQRQFIGRLCLQRDSAAWTKQLLRLRPRGHEALLQVERILRIRHRVHRSAKEQAVTPEYRVLAGFDVDRHIARIEVREHERIEPLARRSLGIALGIRAQRTGDRQPVDQRIRGRGVGVVQAAVGEILPRGIARAEAVLSLVDEVEFRQQIHAGSSPTTLWRNCGHRRPGSG